VGNEYIVMALRILYGQVMLFSVCTPGRGQHLWLVSNSFRRAWDRENYARGRTKSLSNFEVAANAVAVAFEVRGLIA